MFTRFPIHHCALAIACQPGASPFNTFRSLLSLGFRPVESLAAVYALSAAGAL